MKTKKPFAAVLVLCALLAALLSGCGSETPTPTATPMPTAASSASPTPAVTPMPSLDPENGEVTDEDGVLGDEPKETKMPDSDMGKRR